MGVSEVRVYFYLDSRVSSAKNAMIRLNASASQHVSEECGATSCIGSPVSKRRFSLNSIGRHLPDPLVNRESETYRLSPMTQSLTTNR